MKKLIFLLCFLVAISLVPNLASGQQGQAMLKIVKSEDGTVTIYNMNGNELQPSSARAGEPAPIQSSSNSRASKVPLKPKMTTDSLEIPSAREAIKFEPKEINANPATWQTNPDKKVQDATAGVMNPGPDLTLYMCIDSYNNNWNVTLYERVRNSGTASSGSCYLGYFLSTDKIVGADLYLGQDLVSPLMPGMEQELSRNFDLGLYPGIWYILRIIDYTGVVDEDNESNNFYFSLFFGPGPNLKVTSVNWSYSVTHQLDIHATVLNNGTVSAGSSVLGFYLSADMDISTFDLKIGDLPVFSLSPGAETVKSFTTIGDICKTVPSGIWYVGAVIDETNAVDELNEFDNVHLSFEPLSINDCSIIVTHPNGGETWDEGSTQTIRWTSSNTSGNVKISYSLDSGTSWTTIQDNMPDNHSASWVVPEVGSDQPHCRIKIEDVLPCGCSDISDADFTIRNAAYTLNIDMNPPGSGSVSKDPDKTNYNHNESVQLKANAAPGYRFDHWSGDLSGNNNPAELVMDGDKSISALFVSNASADYIWVINCSDTGPGSFREAIHIANRHAGPDTILFAIPEGVPGYQADAGIWAIQPQTELPLITDGKLLIYAFSQSTFIGRDTNPDGPEIVLDGHQAGQDASGLHLAAPEVSIVGLTVQRYGNVGIWMDRVAVGHIAGCYIGTDHSGTVAAPNGLGICIGNRCQHVTVAPMDTFRNVITGNINGGILVSDTSHAITLLNNMVGLDRTSQAAPGNGGFGGLCIQEHCDSVLVFDNRIGGNTCGVLINNSARNTIQSNWIGISPENLDLKPGDLIPLTGNKNDGIYIAGESTDNLISQNIICQNEGPGVGIYGELPIRNRISQNCISQNIGSGILYASAGANMIPAPIITSATGTSVSGTAIPNATIEFYTDAEDEGQMFQGETRSGSDGHFNWTGVIAGPLPNITALAINAEGSTSPFSSAFTTAVEEPPMVSMPSLFSLEQNYPNPFNPETIISYTIPSTSRVRLTVHDILGQEVAVLVDEVKQPGVYQAIFNGVNCPSGLHFYTLEAGGNIIMRKMMLLK